MLKKKNAVLVFILLIALSAGCSSGSYENIDPSSALELVNDKEVVVLDVRNPDEYNAGHIPGSELMPLQLVDSMSDQLEKDEVYLVVCRSGNRSQQASEILASKGFTVLNMTGGMNNWVGEIE